MFDFSDLSALFGGSSGTDLTSGGFDPGQIGVGDIAPTPAPSGGGFDFGDLASAVKSGASAVGDFLYTAPTQKGGEAGGVLGTVAKFAKPLLPFAQLGTAGMGIASGIQGAKAASQNAATARRAQQLQENVAGQQAAAAAPLTEFGKKQLDAATAGTVPEAVEAQIQQLLQGWIQSARDYAARSGQGNSLMLTQWENWLKGQAEALRSSWLQEQQRTGVASLSAGAAALGGAGQTAGQIQTGAQAEGAATAQLIEQTNRALASLTAGAS